MGLELGTAAWVEAWRDAINAAPALRDTGDRWHWPVGIAIREEGGLPTRFLKLDCNEGVCGEALVVDEATYEQLPFGLSATYSRWRQLLSGEIDPLRALIFHRIDLRGDLPTLIRHVGCAKAVLDAARQIDTELPAAVG